MLFKMAKSGGWDVPDLDAFSLVDHHRFAETLQFVVSFQEEATRVDGEVTYAQVDFYVCTVVSLVIFINGVNHWK